LKPDPQKVADSFWVSEISANCVDSIKSRPQRALRVENTGIDNKGLVVINCAEKTPQPIDYI
jgi:hypothetical protein